MRSKHVELVATPETNMAVLHSSHTNGTHKLTYRLRPGVRAEELLPGIPTSTTTQNPNNGNEHRQSYHQLPENFVAPIQSPTQFDFTPMQINTRGPNGRGTGPLPRASAQQPGGKYPEHVVPILECPCTSRVHKAIKNGTENLPFGKGVGTINGKRYQPGCHEPPLTSLLPQRNPSCDVRTYVGGMQCCGHKTILLDADQEPPPFVDEVFFKWRFYYREFRPATDTAVLNLVWYISAAADSIEYDAPAAPAGTPPEEAVHTITSNFTGADFATRSGRVDAARAAGGIKLTQMGGHCHSPGCLSLELWNTDTGAKVCHITPVSGTGTAAQDEENYLYLPPCVWSESEGAGLPKPFVFYPDTNFSAVKRVNNSVYHYGIMAIFQTTGAYVK